MKIIILTGKAGVGKDTFAKKLQNYYGIDNQKVFIAAYADILKNIVTRNFGYNGIKNEIDRKILQSVGDLFRDTNKNFFIKPIVDMVETTKALDFKYFIITDARFDNEVEPFVYNKNFDTEVIELTRAFKTKLGETRNHKSENGISRSLISKTIILPNNEEYYIEEYLPEII